MFIFKDIIVICKLNISLLHPSWYFILTQLLFKYITIKTITTFKNINTYLNKYVYWQVVVLCLSHLYDYFQGGLLNWPVLWFCTSSCKWNVQLDMLNKFYCIVVAWLLGFTFNVADAHFIYPCNNLDLCIANSDKICFNSRLITYQASQKVVKSGFYS